MERTGTYGTFLDTSTALDALGRIHGMAVIGDGMCGTNRDTCSAAGAEGVIDLRQEFDRCQLLLCDVANDKFLEIGQRLLRRRNVQKRCRVYVLNIACR